MYNNKLKYKPLCVYVIVYNRFLFILHLTCKLKFYIWKINLHFNYYFNIYKYCYCKHI